ncbi:hypothetical protein CA11_10600 [Gimesia maris]|nr:hypothetical protein CA11_10600 [Gimesia maris]
MTGGYNEHVIPSVNCSGSILDKMLVPLLLTEYSSSLAISQIKSDAKFTTRFSIDDSAAFRGRHGCVRLCSDPSGPGSR